MRIMQVYNSVSLASLKGVSFFRDLYRVSPSHITSFPAYPITSSVALLKDEKIEPESLSGLYPQ